MFNLKAFIVTNIVNGVKNGTFTKEYANIMAVNYMLKGALAEDDVISVSTQIEAWEAEQEAQNALNTEISDTVEEEVTEEETDVYLGEYEATDGDLLEESISNTDDGEPLT